MTAVFRVVDEIGHSHELNFESDAELEVIELVPDGGPKRPETEYGGIGVHYSIVSDETSTEQTGA